MEDLKKPNHGCENLSEEKSNVAEHKAIIEKVGPQLNAFIDSTKALRPNFQFPFSNFNVPRTLTSYFNRGKKRQICMGKESCCGEPVHEFLVYV